MQVRIFIILASYISLFGLVKMGEVDLDHDMAALAAGRDLEQLLVKTDAASDHIGLKRHNSFVFDWFLPY